MADGNFKVDRYEFDREGLERDLKAQMPDFHSESDIELNEQEKHSGPIDVSPGVNRAPVDDFYESDFDYENSEKRYSEVEEGESAEQLQEQEETDKEHVVPEEQVTEQNTEEEGPQEGVAPVMDTNQPNMEMPVGGNKPALNDPKNNPIGKQAGNKPDVGGGDPKSKAANALGNMMNNQGNGPKANTNAEAPEGQNFADEQKSKKEREIENNANTINNAADVAIASKNPYAMAAGGIIKAADKLTGGRSTKLLGKAMRTANKISPGGRKLQDASNKLAESGVGDKIGQAASMKSGGAGAGAGAANNASKAAEAGEKAKKAQEAGEKAKKAQESGDKAKKATSKKGGDNKGGNNKGSNNNGGSGSGTQNTEGSTKFGNFIKDALKHFILTHPFAVIVIGVLAFLFLLLLLGDDFEGGKGGARRCSYNLNGVTTSGNVQLDNLQVELINCDGTASNYTVLETVDFEKYVLGVALAEIGESSPDEGIKAQIIAARNFALTRNKGMCPSNPDGCFYGYNTQTGKIRMRACEADQVYWDYDKDIYRQDRGSISLYSPEITSGTVWKRALSEERKLEVLALAESVKGKVLLDDSGNVLPTSYKSTDQVSMLEDARAGKNYEEILEHKYGSSKYAGATCSNYGNIDYGNYELSSEGDTILNERLDRFLEKKGTSLEDFNNLIKSNVEKNGYGTRAGVVAAGVTLIAELGNNYDVKVPYFLSGGHHDGVRTGALGYWGSGVEDDGRVCRYSGYGNIYTVCGLDCSGFVPWAIKNGGFQMGVRLAGDFYTLDGARKVGLSSNSAVLEPGDLLESSGHIVLVVGIDENTKQYICAEASGKEAGVLFTRRPFGGGGDYWGVKMDGYYNKYSLAGK